MEASEIIEFCKAKINPITNTPLYRCSVTMVDGLYLPCVIITNKQRQIDLAIRRFQECRDAEPSILKRIFGKTKPKNLLFDYRHIVSHFVCSGNIINDYEIKSMSECPYAISQERMFEIKGETSMGWTQFTAQMKDGKEFEFGTTFNTEFFDMPDGYTSKDIVKIIPAERGSPRNFEMNILREKPFFTCYIDGV